MSDPAVKEVIAPPIIYTMGNKNMAAMAEFIRSNKVSVLRFKMIKADDRDPEMILQPFLI